MAVRAAALDVVAGQQTPSPTVLSTLYALLNQFGALHGDAELGCVSRCPTRCLHGVNPALPSEVSRACISACAGACMEMMTYESHVLDVLAIHDVAVDPSAVSKSRGRMLALYKLSISLTGAVGAALLAL